MRHYEIVFLVHPDQSEQVPAMVERYRNMITASGGKIHREEDWGRRQLEFPIKKIHKAHYVLMNIECEKGVLDELESAFRELLQIRLDQNHALMSLIWTTEGIESVVRERLPSPELPIDVLGVRGSAIDGIWAETRFLTREANDGWWSADIALEDGMVKFLANEDYAISWGVEPDWSKLAPFVDATHYLGDPAAVFPTGTAVFDGQNIPVTSGRYRVRFNSRTFEYSFELL